MIKDEIELELDQWELDGVTKVHLNDDHQYGGVTLTFFLKDDERQSAHITHDVRSVSKAVIQMVRVLERKGVKVSLKDNPRETREDHLKWCKARALKYLPSDKRGAASSFISDMHKHAETSAHPMLSMVIGEVMFGGSLKNFILGFN